MTQLNENFLFKSIRKYNQAQRQTQKDAVLNAVGVHAGLLAKSRNPLPLLEQEERDRVLNFLKQFLAEQGVEASIKD